MKLRTGFVSNSSTASFIVRIKQDSWHKVKDELFLANEEDIIKLEEYGFERTNATNPFDSNGTTIKTGDPGTDHYISMKYFVTSNYEEQVAFLVKNNIPFKASCHYGHKYMSYKKDSDYIFKATNYGLIFNMYGEDHFDYFTEQDMKNLNFKPYRKIPKSEFLGDDNE
jgi:hypothetical protein